MLSRTFLMSLLLTAALLGCAAVPDAEREAAIPEPATPAQSFYQMMTELHAAAESGDATSRKQYVDRVMANMGASNAPMMFAAAQFALQEQSLSNAAYLFYAGRLRIATDRYSYELDDPKIDPILKRMAADMGTQINPLIMQRPGEYAAVVSQLYAWDMGRAETYNPGWSGALRVSAEQQNQYAAELKALALSEMDALVFLLNIPAYYQAFVTVQSYNRLSEPDRAIQENIEIVQAAMKTMSDIEEREGVYVFSQVPPPQ